MSLEIQKIQHFDTQEIELAAHIAHAESSFENDNEVKWEVRTPIPLCCQSVGGTNIRTNKAHEYVWEELTCVQWHAPSQLEITNPIPNLVAAEAA